MDFSEPYFPVQIVVVQKIGAGLSSAEDLSGGQAAAFEASTADEALREVEGVEVVRGASLEDMFQKVAAGELRAAAADSSAVIPVIDRHPDVEIAFSIGETQQFGFAMKKGSPLLKPLSKHIRELRESGVYLQLISQHLGERARDVVRSATLPEH